VRKDKKWKNNSDKTRAYKLRNTINPVTGKNWVDEDILLLFYKNPVDNTKGGPSHPPPPPTTIQITEDIYEKYLCRLVDECDPSPSIASAIRDYLDKKKMLTTSESKADINEEDRMIDELAKIPLED